MIGGLHLEVGGFGQIGKLLRESGWEKALAQAEVVTSGRANSVIHASHLKRTQFAHEVSVVPFSKLKAEAYIDADTKSSYDD